MITAILLKLTSAQDVILHTHVGRANYAATLERLNDIDPNLTATLHQGDGPKPLTCSGILNAQTSRQGLEIVAGRPYYVRMTGLTDAVSQPLLQGLVTNPPATWSLDDHEFQVSEATCADSDDGWTGGTSYEDLALSTIQHVGHLPRQVTLEFVTPVTFRSGGLNIPIPLPSLVFGSLAERWNTFSPVSLSPETRRFAEEMIGVSKYQLESRPVVQKNGALRIGGQGWVTYRVFTDEPYWLGVLHMLARYAPFSGVGAQTTTGMGQVRLRG